MDDGETFIIESAKICGMAVLPTEDPGVTRRTSAGVGEAMLWAAANGAKRIIVGIGGTATNDGGIGLAMAAGAVLTDAQGNPVQPGIAGLGQVRKVSAEKLRGVFGGIRIQALCDVKNPLCGPDGATKTYGPQKGLPLSQLDQIDSDMRSYAKVLGKYLGKDPSRVKEAGAGGGLSAALWAFFDAELVDGSAFIMKETGFYGKLGSASVVVTGEGKVDHQTLKGKIPAAVARAAHARGIPCIVLAGGVSDSIVDSCPPEFSAVLSSVLRPSNIDEAVRGGPKALSWLAEQIGRLARICSVKKEISAGGIVLRRSSGCNQVLLIKDRVGRYALPKGHIDPGETEEEAALREVWEETGIRCEIIRKIGSVKYTYQNKYGDIVEKEVFYYLMKSVSGEIKPQDGETLDCFWVAAGEYDRLPRYSNNDKIINLALNLKDFDSMV